MRPTFETLALLAPRDEACGCSNPGSLVVRRATREPVSNHGRLTGQFRR